MSLTINTKTFTADGFAANSVKYIGPAKTTSVKDDVSLSRTSPRATSAFSGNGRVQAKLTRTLTLTGALTSLGDAIVDINVQLPVGYASADADALFADMGSFLSSADAKTFLKTQKINF